MQGKRKDVTKPVYEFSIEGITPEQLDILQSIMTLDVSVPHELFPMNSSMRLKIQDFMGELRRTIIDIKYGKEK